MKRCSKKRGTLKSTVNEPCHYCKRPMLPPSYMNHENPLLRQQTISEEHIIPRSKGGTNDSHNITYACARCNSMRGSLNYEVFLLFSRHVLQNYPNETTILLRSSLLQFVTSLAEIAIKNKKESNRAISLALLKLKDDQNKLRGIYK